MADIVGLIPSAGRGIRAYPYTQIRPKSLLEVDGRSLLARNIELLRDSVGVERIVIVVGHLGDRIREFVGDGSAFGIEISCVQNDRLELELAYSIHVGCREIDGPCCVVLADECYVGTNHGDLTAAVSPDALVTCGLIEAEYPRAVRANYTVDLDEGRIVGLREKPQRIDSLLMGTGTYLIQPEAQRRLALTFAGGGSGPGDWTTWLNTLAQAGEHLGSFCLKGRYVNVNGRNELNLANHLLRDQFFERRSVSVVYVCDEDLEDLRTVIRPFIARSEVTEVVLVARRSTPSLEEIGSQEKVRLMIHADPEAPVGEMVRAGLDSATGDLLVTTLSDDTFVAQDLAKLLVFLRDADLVVGTRTTRQMIEQGSNMRGLVRWVHLVLAKLLEILWWKVDSRFTDICCVYRGIWRNTYHLIRGQLTSRGVEIFPEMVIEVLRSQRRVIEIPVNYYNRNLIHSEVHSRYQNAGTFLRILRLMLRKRFAELFPVKSNRRRAS